MLTDHGPADQTKLTERIDHPGCHRCHTKTRAYTTIGGQDYCDKCAELVNDLNALFADCEALVGTGEP